MTYNDLETAYRQNMFAPDGQKKETLVEAVRQFDDKAITGEYGKSLYHLAACFLDYPAIEYLIAEGIKPRADDYNNTPLHDLAKTPYANNKVNIPAMEQAIYNTARILIDAGVNPKKKNDSGQIAYAEAAQACLYPYIKAVAEAGVKMDTVVNEGKNLICKICDSLYHRKNIEGERECAYRTIDVLMESGLDHEEKDIFGKDALHYAQQADVKEIAALLSGQADDEAALKTGGMTLTQSILNNDMAAIEANLEQGADPNEVEQQERTPLMWACEYPKPEIVQLLLKYKADPNYTVGETGATAIAYLLSKSIQHVHGSPQDLRRTYTTILHALLDAGLDVNAPVDAAGNTALIYVANMDYFADQNYTLAEELIEAGADVNRTNLAGVTPLMAFAVKGDEQEHGIAELLLDNGADPSLADKTSNTALMYAASNRNRLSAKKIAELILDSGYEDLDRTNNSGQTAMDIAVSRENEALVKLLLG